MNKIWQLNRKIRASKLSSKETDWTGATGKFLLTHSAPYQHSVAAYSKADPHTSSHCAMIPVPPYHYMTVKVITLLLHVMLQ
jgi:hypothetical protein